MNENKICFIACVNDDEFFSECLMYIDRLVVPEGFEVDVLSINDAKSMTSGYNEGMEASDAKYKIYLHQDTFMMDIYFLQELIDIFTQNPDIGMVGAVGTPKMPQDACMWHSEEVWAIYRDKLQDLDRCGELKPYGSYDLTSVEAIDGLLMATQYDIPWREDLFTDFDFYDASQSMEFIRKGYKVVVPMMNKPICVHDDGTILNLINYDNNRKKFINEYKELFNR